MPTGYTHNIGDGISFEQFVMQCARGMGALVTMRDEPLDAPIPEQFEPSTYNTRRLDEAISALAKLRAMRDDEANAAAQKAFAAEVKDNTEQIARIHDLHDKYKAMLSQVQTWTPPTPDHEEFKRFMVSQISESIKFDCDDTYYREHQPQQKTGAGWRAEQIGKAIKDIEYHSAEHAKEIERTESRNNWLKALRESLS